MRKPVSSLNPRELQIAFAEAVGLKVALHDDIVQHNWNEDRVDKLTQAEWLSADPRRGTMAVYVDGPARVDYGITVPRRISHKIPDFVLPENAHYILAGMARYGSYVLRGDGLSYCGRGASGGLYETDSYVKSAMMAVVRDWLRSTKKRGAPVYKERDLK